MSPLALPPNLRPAQALPRPLTPVRLRVQLCGNSAPTTFPPRLSLQMSAHRRLPDLASLALVLPWPLHRHPLLALVRFPLANLENDLHIHLYLSLYLIQIPYLLRNYIPNHELIGESQSGPVRLLCVMDRHPFLPPRFPPRHLHQSRAIIQTLRRRSGTHIGLSPQTRSVIGHQGRLPLFHPGASRLNRQLVMFIQQRVSTLQLRRGLRSHPPRTSR